MQLIVVGLRDCTGVGNGHWIAIGVGLVVGYAGVGGIGGRGCPDAALRG